MYVVEKESCPPIEEWDIETVVSVAVPVTVPVAAVETIIARVPPSFHHGVILLICLCTLLIGFVLLEVFVFKGIDL